MGIVSVNKLFTGRGGTDSYSRRRTWREVYEVVTDSIADDESVVAQAAGVPRIGQRHERYPQGVVTDVESEQSEDVWTIWYVRIKYDTSPDMPNSVDPTAPNGGGGDNGPNDPANVVENPLLRPAQWKVFFEDAQEVVTEWRRVAGFPKREIKDTLSKIGNLFDPVLPEGTISPEPEPVRNSAKLPFDPAPMVDVNRLVLQVTKNLAQVTIPYMLHMHSAVNAKPWKGAPARTLRCKLESSNKFENGVAFVEVTWNLTFRPETWDLRILDAGNMELGDTDPVSGLPKWREITGVFGGTGGGPFPLDGAGKLLKALKPNGDPVDPVFLRGVPVQQQLVDFGPNIPV